MLLVGCLSWRHPLQSGTFVGSGNLDLDINRVALWYLRWQGDGEWAAVRLYTVANIELDTLALNLYDGDVQVAEMVSGVLNSVA